MGACQPSLEDIIINFESFQTWDAARGFLTHLFFHIFTEDFFMEVCFLDRKLASLQF